MIWKKRYYIKSIQKSNEDNQILVGIMINYNDQNIYSYYLEQYEYIFEIIENTQCVFKLEITIINNGKNQ